MKGKILTIKNYSSRISEHLPLVTISLFFAIFFRLRDLGRDIVLGDEMTSIYYYILPSLKSFYFLEYFTTNNHFFHSFIAHLSVLVFGENEIAVRLPVLIAGISAVVFIYWWAFLIFKSKEIAFVSSLLLAFSTIHIAYSQTARGYALIILFSLSAQLSLYKIIEGYKFRWMVVFVISNIFNSLTIPSSLFFVASQYLSLLIIFLFPGQNLPAVNKQMGKQTIKRLAVSSLVIFTPVFLFYLYLHEKIINQASMEGHHLSLMDVVNRLINNHLILGSPRLFLGIFLYGCWILYKKSKFWGPFTLLLLFSPFFVSGLVGIVGPPRVYLFSLPSFIFITAIGFYTLADSVLKPFIAKYGNYPKLKNILVFSILSLFIISTISFLEKNYYPKYHQYKYKNLREHMDKIPGSDNLFFIPGNDWLFKYYLNGLIEKNALGIYHSKDIKDIYLVKHLKTLSDDFSIENRIHEISGSRQTLIREFGDIDLNTGAARRIIDNTPPKKFSLHKLQPSNIKKIPPSDFLEGNWIQVKGALGVDIRRIQKLDLLKFNLNKGVAGEANDTSLLYSDAPIRLNVNKKGFIYLVYALTYPGIEKILMEPLTPVFFSMDENTGIHKELSKYVLNKNVSGYENKNKRMWSIIQKVVPLEAGKYNLSFGFSVRRLDGSWEKPDSYFVKGLQAILVEF